MSIDHNNTSTILYLDCSMGAAGDMLAAALYELLEDEDKAEFINMMNSLVPDRVSVSVRPDTKCGILGTHFDVTVDGEEEHSIDHHEHTHVHVHAHDDHDHEHTHEHSQDHDHHHTHEHSHGNDHHDHEHVHEHTHGHDHHHTHGHCHSHHSMADVIDIISGFTCISDKVRSHIIDVYGIIAGAESAVHGTDVSEIHFHEVGMMDAVIDVTAVCVLMDMLGADKVYASPVRTGKGHMRCAHGILPVPAPATANILLGIPTYAGSIDAELCTPTGAALLRYFASEFIEQPVMAVSRIGYGMGTKDFEICNCVRAMLQRI